MRLSASISLLVLSVLVLNTVSLAFETDQYNLSKIPLADVGDEVSEHLIERLRTTVGSVNAEIAKSEACLETKAKACDSPDKERARLDRLRSTEAIAESFFTLVAGSDLMTTKFGKWMNSHNFQSQPSRYKAGYSESIYILNPFDYATLSPTVRLYSHEFGIDKLEHLLQQGYQYYKIYNEAVRKGSTKEEAAKMAIKWGQQTERTYYGLLTSGVYSNGDLFANYVGMKFYLGMTGTLDLGETRRPALVGSFAGRWKINEEGLKKNILRPFIADQMNEALNPSSYRATLFGSVRRSVEKYACPEWRGTIHSKSALEKASEGLDKWNGEDYGSTKRSRSISLSEICFSDLL